jgi:hypothetical protein
LFHFVGGAGNSRSLASIASAFSGARRRRFSFSASRRCTCDRSNSTCRSSSASTWSRPVFVESITSTLCVCERRMSSFPSSHFTSAFAPRCRSGLGRSPVVKPRNTNA